MSALENAFRNAVANAHDQRGKPAILGKSDGTLYWVDPSGMTHRTRVWARIGEQASNQEVVVDCLRASPQIDMPVRVDYMNGRMTVVDVDSQRAVEFSGGRPPGAGAHAWTHNRLGPDPVFIEGLQFLPLLVTPTSPPDLTVTVQSGAYTDDAGDLAIHDTAASGSLSAFVPGTGHHFVIVCLDRTDGSIVLVDGSDVTVEDALFGDAVVTAADIEAITISDDYKPLGVVLLYASQTQIKARDIIKDLRNDGGAGGGGTPGGSDTQLQYNNGGAFGGIPDAIYNDGNGRLLLGATSPETTAKLEIHPTPAQDARNALVSTQAVSAANTVGFEYYLNNATPALTKYGEISVGSTTNTAGSEYGVAKIDVIRNGAMVSALYLDATSGLTFNNDSVDMDTYFRGANATALLSLNAGADEVRIGSTTPLEGGVAVFGSSGVVINDEEADRDFRIAGNGVTNGYFYDAGLNRHGFGTGSPLDFVSLEGVGPIIASFNWTTTSNYGAFRFRENGTSVGSLQFIGSTFVTSSRQNYIELFNNTSTGGISLHTNNTPTPRLYISANGSVVVGSPTGGPKGAGTINAQAVYDDNVLLSDHLWDLYYDGRMRPADAKRHDGARLWTIDETAVFTKEHRHLPTLPSRDDWESGGTLSIGSLITGLWQAVELLQMQIYELKEGTND